jgi:hypothetical protein
MSDVIGGQLTQLIELSKDLGLRANELEEIRAAVESRITETWWVGPAADRFREAWNADLASFLTRVGMALEEASTEVRSRHDALIEAGA